MNSKTFIVAGIILSAALTLSLIGLFQMRKKVDRLEDALDLEKGNTYYNQLFNSPLPSRYGE